MMNIFASLAELSETLSSSAQGRDVRKPVGRGAVLEREKAQASIRIRWMRALRYTVKALP